MDWGEKKNEDDVKSISLYQKKSPRIGEDKHNRRAANPAVRSVTLFGEEGEGERLLEIAITATEKKKGEKKEGGGDANFLTTNEGRRTKLEVKDNSAPFQEGERRKE